MLKFIILIFTCLIIVQAQLTVYDKNINFYVQNAIGDRFNFSFANETDISLKCEVTGNYTILIHGWNEHYNTHWVKNTINNFASYRKGCVFFMDYGFYSKLDYGTLMTHFNGIRTVVTKFLGLLENIGFNPDLGWLFGFSYGAHLAFEGAYQYGPLRLARLDACDPAGPGFVTYPNPSLQFSADSVKHANQSAKAVQCLHTSGDYGTIYRYCQFDMNLGDCGRYQPGATAPPVLSHGLCPVFYNNSITYDYQVIPKPAHCIVYNTTVDVTNLPKPLVMGVRFDTSLPAGEYYFPTTAKYPYN